MYSFPNLEPVYSSMSSSNSFFLTCVQVSQKAGQVVLYSHLLMNFPQFIVIHTVKGFSIVNEAEVGVFLEFPCFLYDLVNAGNLSCSSSAFSKSSLYIWKFSIHILLKTSLKDFEHYFAAAAKSLQSCPTLWDPIDSSPPGSSVSLGFLYLGWAGAISLQWTSVSRALAQ